MLPVSIRFVLLCTLLGSTAPQAAEQLYQAIPADAAPALSKPGKFQVGVRTVKFAVPASLQVSTGQTYDRPLTLGIRPAPVSRHRRSIKTRPAVAKALVLPAARFAMQLRPAAQGNYRSW